MTKYFKIFFNTLSTMKTFMLDFYLGFVSIPIQAIIVFFFWKSAIEGQNPLGYNFVDLGLYFFYVQMLFIVYMPSVLVAYEVWQDINSGNIMIWLSKPISYPVMYFSKKIAEFIPRFFLSFIIIIISQITLGNKIAFMSLVLGVMFTFNGFIIYFLVNLIIGLSTFWVEKVISLKDNVYYLILLLGGQVLPIDIFPPMLQKIATVLPFSAIYFYPAKIFSTSLILDEYIDAIILQYVWIAVLLVVSAVVWKHGKKKYIPFGG